MLMKNNKIFILDTNVILRDSACIYQFGESTVIIPETVFEELDQFNKCGKIINFHARKFLRTLDVFRGDPLFNGGFPIGQGPDIVTVKCANEPEPDLAINCPHEDPFDMIPLEISLGSEGPFEMAPLEISQGGEDPFEMAPLETSLGRKPVSNEYFILKNDSKSFLTVHDWINQKITHIDK